MIRILILKILFKSTYFIYISNKQIGLIDYSNGNNFIKSSQINSTGYPNRPFIPNPKSGQNFLQNDIKKSTSTPMINHGGSTNLLSKSSNIKQGPIK